MDRKQKAVKNNFKSTIENTEWGVPQGSILGPLLFLMFINDSPLYTNNVSKDIYADDTTLNMVGKTQDYIKQNFRTGIAKTFCVV